MNCIILLFKKYNINITYYNMLPSTMKSSTEILYRPPTSLTSASATFVFYVSYILANNPYVEEKVTPIKRTKSYTDNLCSLH